MTTCAARIAITNVYGLHVRPAEIVSRLVRCSGSEVTAIDTKGHTVDAGDMNGLLTLGAKQGDIVTFEAVGRDAEAVLERIEKAV